jgi:hypothetical protein
MGPAQTSRPTGSTRHAQGHWTVLHRRLSPSRSRYGSTSPRRPPNPVAAIQVAPIAVAHCPYRDIAALTRKELFHRLELGYKGPVGPSSRVCAELPLAQSRHRRAMSISRWASWSLIFPAAPPIQAPHPRSSTASWVTHCSPRLPTCQRIQPPSRTFEPRRPLAGGVPTPTRATSRLHVTP